MLKARDNPFASHRLHKLNYRLPGISWDEIIDKLRGLGFRAAVVGDEGTGKTTFVRELAQRLRANGYCVQMRRLSFGVPVPRVFFRQLSSVPDSTVIILDGADLLPTVAWYYIKYVVGRNKRLIIASHRQGLLPTLIHSRGSQVVLRELLSELIGPCPEHIQHNSLQLLQRHNGDMRKVFRDLYDACSG